MAFHEAQGAVREKNKACFVGKYTCDGSHVRISFRPLMERLFASLRLRRLPRVLYWSPLVFFCARQFPIHTVSGRSMQPTLNPDESMLRNDVGLFCRLPVYYEDFRRGDIVAMRSPTNPHRMLIKRIIALPGDTVKALQPWPDAVVTIPQGHMWVEGDDPYHSYDSNHFGAVPLALVESRLTGLLWPLERAGPSTRLLRDPKALERQRLREKRLVASTPLQTILSEVTALPEL